MTVPRTSFVRAAGRFAVCALLFAFLHGCSKKNEKQSASPPAGNAPAPGIAPAAAPSALAGGDFSTRTDKLKFRNAVGKTLFSIKLKDDGAKLIDGDEKELARLKNEKREDGPEIKIKSSDEKVLGTLGGPPGKWKLKDADKTLLFSIRHEADDSYKIEDADGALVYRLKPREGGADVEDAMKATLFKVTAAAQEVTVRNATNKVILVAPARVAPMAAACLVLDRLTPPQRAALFLLVDPPKAGK